MPPTDDAKPSFSRGQRWRGALNMVVAATAALAVVVMVNYLSTGHFLRFQWSRDAAFKLSRQTKAVLESLTNEVRVTIFFDPKGANQEIYALTQALLTEYQNANPRHIHVRPLDYTRYAGRAKDLLPQPQPERAAGQGLCPLRKQRTFQDCLCQPIGRLRFQRFARGPQQICAAQRL